MTNRGRAEKNGSDISSRFPNWPCSYSEITDYRSAEDIGIDRPQKRTRYQYPADTPADGVHRTTGAVRQIGRCHAPGPPAALGAGGKERKCSVTTDYARKMSLDMRMIDPELYSDHVDNKASHCARMIACYYRRFEAYKGAVRILRPGNLQTRGGGTSIPRYGVNSRRITAYPKSECGSSRRRPRKSAQGDDRRYEHRKNPRTFGSTEMLGTGERAETLRGDTPPGLPLASQRPGAARGGEYAPGTRSPNSMPTTRWT